MECASLLFIFTFSGAKVELLLVIIVERPAPGTLASIGALINGIDQLNAMGPHLEIQPIIRFQ
jgi:hypothetical protein